MSTSFFVFFCFFGRSSPDRFHCQLHVPASSRKIHFQGRLTHTASLTILKPHSPRTSYKLPSPSTKKPGLTNACQGVPAGQWRPRGFENRKTGCVAKAGPRATQCAHDTGLHFLPPFLWGSAFHQYLLAVAVNIDVGAWLWSWFIAEFRENDIYSWTFVLRWI